MRRTRPRLTTAQKLVRNVYIDEAAERLGGHTIEALQIGQEAYFEHLRQVSAGGKPKTRKSRAAPGRARREMIEAAVREALEARAAQPPAAAPVPLGEITETQLELQTMESLSGTAVSPFWRPGVAAVAVSETTAPAAPGEDLTALTDADLDARIAASGPPGTASPFWSE